ncbi:MAG: hypothetical protein QXG65_01455 [Thermoplasmata archaeon]
MEALRPITAEELRALRWMRIPEARHTFLLTSETGAHARLAWDRGGHRQAQLWTVEGEYALVRRGFLRPRVTMYRTGENAPRGELAASHDGEGGVSISVGEEGGWRLARAGRAVPAWTLTRKDGAEAAHIEPVREGATLDGAIIAVPAGAMEPGAAAYVLALAWYFIALAWAEDEIVAEWVDHAEGQF